MEYLLQTMDMKDKYRLLTNCIVPRPIAWVTTVSNDGVFNAAPFSFFTGISIEPPLVLFAVERRHGEKKDTVINIEETKEFVINLVTEQNVEKMNITSKDFDLEEDEIDLAGLKALPSKCVRPPSIGESPLHMECKLHQIIEIGSSPHSLVIGEVLAVTVDDSVIKNERIDMESLQAVGRMGGKWYTKTPNLFELERLDWRKAELNS
jgi:flavin reductase (DIM6/NTAB) family NADH-FMN oxidoreductase RutF